MNAYRVALILCRAISVELWLSAALNLIAGEAMALVVRSGALGTMSLPSGLSSFLFPLGTSIFSAITALFVQVFAHSLSASITGSFALEGESILSRRALEPQELALARAGAGLAMLLFGVSSALYVVCSNGYDFLTGAYTPSVATSFAIYNLISSLIPIALRCLIGFILAFHLGLRRLVKAGAA